ncbi:MAG: protease inhibitor I42 family protein [Euryarchaeota archaeon]|nr:protease inhibitor I42 family protein [Euryarchaeota archaeon]
MQKADLLPPINATVGDIFEISIPSNLSTGYSCLLSSMPDCVYFVESSYTADQPAIPGSGGTSKFKFVAVKEGNGQILFNSVKFSRPLEILDPTPMQERFVIVKG